MIAALSITACESVVTIQAEEPITPISMILVNPSAFHRKLLKIEGIAEGVRPYSLFDITSVCGASFKVTDDTGTIEVSFRQRCQVGEEKATFVNEGSRVIVEGSLEAPSSVVRNEGKDHEVALYARSVVPSKK
jgi:hypothetical protein